MDKILLNKWTNIQVDIIKNDKQTIKKQTKRNEDEQTHIQKDKQKNIRIDNRQIDKQKKLTNRENDEQRND